MTIKTVPDLAGARILRDDSSNPSTYTDLNTLPDSTFATRWLGRDLYLSSTVTPEALVPDPGTNGFALVTWLYTNDATAMNPGTTFDSYRMFQVGDDDVNSAASSAVAWYVSTRTTDSWQFVVPSQTDVVVALATGWHQYAWAIDCAAGAAPIRAYRDGVLIATSAGNVTSAISLASMRRPAFAIGGHQGGNEFTPILGGTSQIGPTAVFDKNLTTAEILASYNVMTA